jgi:hypothetical protein
MTIYSLALNARVRWAMHRICAIAGYVTAAKTEKSLAIIDATRSGQVAGLADDEVRCPALLDDVEALKNAFSDAMQYVRDVRQKRRTRDGLEAEIAAMANASQRRCGLSYELYVKLFSDEVEGLLSELEPEFRPLALELAEASGYATHDERAAMQEEIEESGGCSLTGIDPDCCPCGRHE